MVHRLGKRAVASLAAATLAVGGMVGVGLRQSNAATPLVGVCQLSGTANFTPNVKATPQTLSYTFTGSFSGCKGNAGVTSGSVSASGSGKLGCAEGTSNGTATINWSNGLNELNKGKSHLAAPQIKHLQKQARSMKKPIEQTVARLATEACTIEKANPGFVSDAALKVDCDNAATLTASAG